MKKQYDKAFKKEAIRLALSGEKSITQTARDLGIKEPILYSWVSQVKSVSPKHEIEETQLTSAELIEELKRIKKENIRLREERDILKKATVFFAQEEQKR